MTHEEAKRLKRFENPCMCGGYAWQMNGRPIQAAALRASADKLVALAAENERLRAKLAALSRQEPAAWVHLDGRGGVVAHLSEPAPDDWLEDGDTCEPLFRAAGAQPGQSVPEGWKLVPTEPTDEMLIDMREKHWKTSGCQLCKADYHELYAAMLAAAPEAPTAPEGGEHA